MFGGSQANPGVRAGNHYSLFYHWCLTFASDSRTGLVRRSIAELLRVWGTFSNRTNRCCACACGLPLSVVIEVSVTARLRPKLTQRDRAFGLSAHTTYPSQLTHSPRTEPRITRSEVQAVAPFGATSWAESLCGVQEATGRIYGHRRGICSLGRNLVAAGRIALLASPLVRCAIWAGLCREHCGQVTRGWPK